MRLTGLFCPHMAGTYQKRSFAGALFLLTLTNRSGSGGAGNQCDGRNSISVEMCEFHRPSNRIPVCQPPCSGQNRSRTRRSQTQPMIRAVASTVGPADLTAG